MYNIIVHDVLHNWSHFPRVILSIRAYLSEIVFFRHEYCEIAISNFLHKS